MSEDPWPTMPERLEQLFIRLQENLDLQLQKQPELMVERWEAKKAVLDKRFGTIEIQLQALNAKFDQCTSIPIPVNPLESRDPIPMTDSRITTPLALQPVPSHLELGYMLKPPMF